MSYNKYNEDDNRIIDDRIFMRSNHKFYTNIADPVPDNLIDKNFFRQLEKETGYDHRSIKRNEYINSLEDEWKICCDCKTKFFLPAEIRKSYLRKRLEEPCRCFECREAKRDYDIAYKNYLIKRKAEIAKEKAQKKKKTPRKQTEWPQFTTMNLLVKAKNDYVFTQKEVECLPQFRHQYVEILISRGGKWYKTSVKNTFVVVCGYEIGKTVYRNGRRPTAIITQPVPSK